MVNKRTPMATAAAQIKALRERLFQYASLLWLWFLLISAEIVMLALRQLLNLPNDIVDYIDTLLVVLLAVPILSSAVKKHSRSPAKTCGMLLIFFLSAEALELTVRVLLHYPNHWFGELAHLLWVLLLIVPLMYFAVMDIRRREFTERQLTYLAYHDVLTGLPNRQRFQHALGLSIRKAKASERSLAVMIINLDRFKNVNDTFGHAFGDQLLVEAAERLKTRLRAGDRVSRQGGNEFALLVDHMGSRQDAEKIAKEIIGLICQPFKIDGHELRVGCSVGIAMCPHDGEDAITMLKNADIAMYRAKDEGRNGYSFYTAEMNDTVIHKLIMEEWLNKALEQDELVLFYQPQVDLFTGRVNGMEALVRWIHPRLGFISPGEFIPLAEETGLIIPLGEWVLRTACMQNVAWQLSGHHPLKVAVNISPVQFHQHDFVQVVLDVLDESGLEPKYLELEITEGIAMYHVDQVIEKLQSLQDLGVHISMDDFGTGYSSLQYLKRFPIDKLKIAQQFVRDITVDPDDAAIVQAIVAMAHSLKLGVIAEGVETEEQLAFLLDLKCGEIQGYIFSKPIPAEEISRLLQRTSA